MGGDHKCPLCSATFTRPQHVGRHLRAHTGDRPYECKECPLRFARSDLLSRHVNKAHKPPDEDGKPPAGKKGRRKSMPSSAHPAPPNPTDQDDDTVPTPTKPRRASFNPSLTAGDQAAMSSTSQYVQPNTAPQPPPLQAQSMYPHHPLLAGTPQPSNSWGNSPPMPMSNINSPSFTNPFNTGTIPQMPQMMSQANGLVSFQPPFTAVPMRLSGSEQGYMSGSPMNRNSSGNTLNTLGYDFGFKKRACDQCNHSKVRCDFAEPCHRCAHRNLRCSYNKPQKSRSIATIPSQRISLPMSNTNGSSFSASDSSPQSHFSSPHSIPSPLNSTMPPPNIPNQAPIPQTAMPSGMVDPNAYMQTWPSSQWQMGGQPMDQSLGLIQQSQSPQSTMLYPSSTSSQYSQLPVALQHRDSAGSSSISSPQNQLAPTPSLITSHSHSTSPSTSDEPEERRQSASYTAPWVDLSGKSGDATVVPDAFANSVSPTMNTQVAVNASSFQPDLNMFAWAPPVTATIDPRHQFRSTGEDEVDGVSRPPSSSASTYHDGHLDDAALAALNHRRRSSASTGIWSNAFNQMTLQDGPGGVIDPYTASQVAQARRPSYPVIHPAIPEGSSYNGSYSSNSGKMPSLGDVKDLWKLFMSEPMTGGMGQTATLEQGDPLSAAVANGFLPASTPTRPAMGARGLSKSNSMPDLTSPLANPQPFFTTYNNGVTPKPTVPQPSYTHQQRPAETRESAETDGEGNAVVMKRWKDSIKTRQASFTFDSNAQAKIKSASPPGGNPLSPPQQQHQPISRSAVTGVPNMHLSSTGRPVASVLQNPALQQTLAPERVPSFGVDALPTQMQMQLQNGSANGKASFRANAAKFSSALARPGVKRLASQTLVPSDHTKKASGEVGDGVGGSWEQGGIVDEGTFQLPGGLAGVPGSTGMTPVGSGPGGQQYFGWNNGGGPGIGMGGGMSMSMGMGMGMAGYQAPPHGM